MDTPRSQVSNRFKKAVKKVIAIDRLAFLNTLNVRTISQNSKEAIKEDEWEPRITKMKQLFNDPEKLLPCFAKSMNLNKINDDKFFIIKYGPPSSGKGTFVPIVTKDLNIKNYISIDVDAFVRVILDKKENEQISQDEYKSKRSQADNVCDEILLTGLNMGIDLLWETTGYSVDWTIQVYIPIIKSYGYKIVLMMPLVMLDKAVKRCEKRSLETGQAAACEKIVNVKEKSAENLPKLAQYCDKILIYNNNKTPTLLFDYENQNAKLMTCNTTPRGLNDPDIKGDDLILDIKNYMKSKKCEIKETTDPLESSSNPIIRSSNPIIRSKSDYSTRQLSDRNYLYKGNKTV
jgi:predicted ABC-type ATPase